MSTPGDHDLRSRWFEYAQRFRGAALAAGRSDQWIESALAYARSLHFRRLPVLFDLTHVAQEVGYAPKYLFAAIAAPDKFYRRFEIPKKRGGHRCLAEPLPSLKEIQRHLLKRLLYRLPVSPYAKAYRPGYGLRASARFHLRQDVVLRLDVRDFFGSLTIDAVRRFFRSVGYTSAVSHVLASLMTLDGALPQGAPTSAYMSNLLLRRFDLRVGAYSRRLGIRYTRYADDMTFSGSEDVKWGAVVRFVESSLSDIGLELQRSKTRFTRRGHRQTCVGLVVNERVSVPRSVRKRFRQECYYVSKFGLLAHAESVGESPARCRNRLIGTAAFILSIHSGDVAAMAALDRLIGTPVGLLSRTDETSAPE